VKGKALLQPLHLCSDKYNNILPGAALVRRPILLLSCIAFLISLSGCGTIYHDYVDREVNSHSAEEKARATRGSINVILLPGCASQPGSPDTLFSCLKLSRDVHPESVTLPPDEKLYLGHISEFILRAFKHYQLKESLKDFYGCRIILKFRKLTPQEMRSRKFTDYSQIAVGAAGVVAGVVTLIPVNLILFLVDGVKTEIDRQEFEERVTRMGLPPPRKGAVTQKLEEGGRTLLYVKDEIGRELTGKASARVQFDDKIASYIVEECVLEKVTPEEMDLYQEQIRRFKKL
jgi:hypothetical protein